MLVAAYGGLCVPLAGTTTGLEGEEMGPGGTMDEGSGTPFTLEAFSRLSGEPEKMGLAIFSVDDAGGALTGEPGPSGEAVVAVPCSRAT